MLTLKLTPLDFDLVQGIYTIGGVKGKMPRSALFLDPVAARSFNETSMVKQVVVSDILRTPESSLKAVKAGRGAKAPGFSGHNFGLSIDIDIKATMKNTGLKTKRELDEWFQGYGWYCHRTDGKMDFEAWHMNFLGTNKLNLKGKANTAGLLEIKIQELYSEQLRLLDPRDVQTALKQLGMYGGNLDGFIGPRSKAAIQVFQRAWMLPITGKIDIKTERTLAFVTRQVQIVHVESST